MTNQSQESPALRFFESRATNVVVGVVLASVFVIFLALAWQKWNNAAKPRDYEGRIVDRWADNSGAAQGYQPRLALLVESNNGKRFTVGVDSNVYESARIGMRIRSRSGQIVLIDSPKDSIGK